MSEPRRSHLQGHTHAWIFGAVGLAAGLVLLVWVPSLKAISGSLLLFGGFHIVGATVLAATLWYSALRDTVRRKSIHAKADTIDFGWEPGWTNGLLVAALIAAAAAVAVEVAAPAWWPLAFVKLFAASAFFAGHLIMRGYRRMDHALLPMVDFLSGEEDRVLDAGSGAGRTTIALCRAAKKVQIIALDRFDAGYIEGGGRALLEHNLRVAGLTDRVKIETGDITRMPFPDAAFDSAVSTHVYDHLGQKKEQALRETFRVLRPGGRFLVALSVPSWPMFAVASFLSLFLTSKQSWRDMAKRAGFDVLDEGMLNGAWFLLLSKAKQ